MAATIKVLTVEDSNFIGVAQGVAANFTVTGISATELVLRGAMAA